MPDMKIALLRRLRHLVQHQGEPSPEDVQRAGVAQATPESLSATISKVKGIRHREDLPAPPGNGEVRAVDPLPQVVKALEDVPPRRDNGKRDGDKGFKGKEKG